MNDIFIECVGRYNGFLYTSATISQVDPTAEGKVRFKIYHHTRVTGRFSREQEAYSSIKITAASGVVLLDTGIHIPNMWDIVNRDAEYYIELDNFNIESWTIRLDSTTIYPIVTPTNSYRITEITKGEDVETLTVTRTSSPSGLGIIGELTAGAWIYSDDILKIDFTIKTGYSTVVTVNGSPINSGETYKVSSDVAVVGSAEPMATISIYHGNQWETYLIYVYEGSTTGWQLYQANVYNGSTWDKYY